MTSSPIASNYVKQRRDFRIPKITQTLRPSGTLGIFWSQVWVILTCLAVYKVGGGPVLYACLAVWAMRGPRSAIQALSLTYLLLFLNPALFPQSGIDLALRWVVFLIAAGQIISSFSRAKLPLPPVVGALFVFCCTVLVGSVVSSFAPITSVFKIISFMLGALFVFLWSRLQRQDSAYWASWFFTLFLTVVCVSLPFYFVPSIGMFRNGRGFQGILSHPQMLAMFMCPMVAWLSCIALINENRSRLVLFTLAVAWPVMFVTQARTAFSSVLFGFLLSVLLMGLAKPTILRASMKRVVPTRKALVGLVFVMAVFCIGIVANGNTIKQGVVEFVTKGDDNTSSLNEGFQKSRGELIADSFNNFQNYPIFGIGFGVPSNMAYIGAEVQAESLSTSAPTEKGFLPSATLEENGFVGSLVLLGLLFYMIRSAIMKGNLPALWMLMTCLLINIGEMVFFSVGGPGGFLWILMGFALGHPANQTRR
jgi:hypothetical protein